ncbi:MAG: hypothetical protein RLY40_451 [Pseudomonadota bacterium]|jgi:hypothetical protein
MMPRSYLIQCILIFLCYSSIDLAYAYPDSTYSQPSLSDEIKQSETNASQAVLDVLNAHADTDNNVSQQSQAQPKSSVATPSPRSNSDKAFTPLDNKSKSSTSSSNQNPWLQPNPWAKQPPNIWEKKAKVNPYSNAPIPGPSPSTNSIVPNPPNIFAPAQPTTNAKQTPQPSDNF